MNRPQAAEGSSTLLVTLMLLLLSGSCLALLMATQTGMLVGSQQKVQARLLAAADAGVELGVARGIAGLRAPHTFELDARAPGMGLRVDVSGLVPTAAGACGLCMTNLEGGLPALGGLRRVSHAVVATAAAPDRADGLPASRRTVTATVDLVPWPRPVGDPSARAALFAAARRGIRDFALRDSGAWDRDAPLVLGVLPPGRPGRQPRTVAIGPSGSVLYAVEVAPRRRELWRFADPGDADGNGAPDLADLESGPALVRLRMGAADRLVAAFGGGFDPGFPNAAGNWLYLLDVDNGRLLYKRPLDGPVVGSPAAADLSGGGRADRLYVGTLAGTLYRIDVSRPARLSGGRVVAGAWRPEPVFQTGGPPIRQPPAVARLPETGEALLAFGAGTRPDSLPPSGPPTPGIFFVVVDPGAGPIGSAATVHPIDPTRPVAGVDRLAPQPPPATRGWSLTLGGAEQPASAPVLALGLVTFLSFEPTRIDGGEVRSYALWLRSGDAADGGQRAVVVDAGAPWPSAALGSPTRIEVDVAGSLTATPSDPLDDLVVQALRDRMPTRCRFDDSRLRVTADRPVGPPIKLAVLPVCRIDADWF